MSKDQRDRLEERLNRLENSYGWGSFRDGLLRDEIAKIRAQLAEDT